MFVLKLSCQYWDNHQIAFKLKIDTFQRSVKILVPNSTMTCLIAQDFNKFIRRENFKPYTKRNILPHLFQSPVWKLVALLKEPLLAPLPPFMSAHKFFGSKSARRYSEVTSYQILVMVAEVVCEIPVFFYQLPWLIDREDFINFSFSESFRS